MKPGNIFESIPEQLDDEVFDSLIQQANVKIERIVSKGHSSPKSGWYEQDHNEWVIVLKGAATIMLEDKELVQLTVGSHLNIPAYTRHKVSWTTPDTETVWIAVRY